MTERTASLIDRLYRFIGKCRHDWMAWQADDDDLTQNRKCRKCNFKQEKWI